MGGAFLAAGGAEEPGGERTRELAAVGRGGSGFHESVGGILADAGAKDVAGARPFPWRARGTVGPLCGNGRFGCTGSESGNSPHSWGRWGQLPAFARPARFSSPHSRGRRASAPRIRGVGGCQAFGGSVGVSSPHSGVRRASAPRIREAGEVQLPAFAGPVSGQLPAFAGSAGVSSPHSGVRRASAPRSSRGRRGSAPRIRDERSSSPHSRGRGGFSFPHSGVRRGSASRIRGSEGSAPRIRVDRRVSASRIRRGRAFGGVGGSASRIRGSR